MIAFAVISVLMIPVLAGGYFCYLCSQSDLIVITSASGREFTIDCSHWFRRRNCYSDFRLSPCVSRVNAFLANFLKSEESRIEFTLGDIRDESRDDPLLAELRGLDYDTVRCRLRVISGFDPVVNQSPEEGLIHMTSYSREVKLRTIFAANGAAIAIEKLG
jgi:hypothetical protein